MQEQAQLRNYIEGDEREISQLMYDNFPNTLEPDSILKTWVWQFKNRFSPSPPVAVAEYGSCIAAQYALMRFPMTYQDSIIDGAISTATVTDKSQRGKGLFTRLAKKLYEDMEKDGCRIVFGFPNTQSIHGFVSRLDWFEIGAFPLHLKIVDFLPLVKRYLGDNVISWIAARICSIGDRVVFHKCEQDLIRDYEIQLVPTGILPDGIELPWKESAIFQRIGLVRDSRYLEWRYLEKPFFNYDIYTVRKRGALVGYFVIYIAEKFGFRTIYVMECAAIADSLEVYSAILASLVGIARERSADSISMLLLPNHPQYRFFRKSGFVQVPRKFLPQKIFFAGKVLSKSIDTAYVKDPRNWYISWGDLDVV
jgi:GNAT superfamily N-acetyltransferase